jgi:hypothetical protein
MLTFASDYGQEAAALADADAHPQRYTYLGPTRTTSVLICIPAYVNNEGGAIATGGPAGSARASLGAAGHIDVDQARVMSDGMMLIAHLGCSGAH